MRSRLLRIIGRARVQDIQELQDYELEDCLYVMQKL